MRDAAARAWRYGDPEARDLRVAIAEHHGVAPENVMPGQGIDGLLGNLVRLIVAPGTPVVTSRGAYPTFNYHVTGFGGVLHAAPYRDDAEDPDALLALARETGAPLVYLANPDNPMGSWRSAGRIADFVAALPEDCLLVLDEAYADFAPPARCRCSTSTSRGDPDAHLLQGARPRRASRRLRPRGAGDHRGV